MIKTLIIPLILTFGIITFLSCNKEEIEDVPTAEVQDSLLLGISGVPINMEYTLVANNSPYTLNQKAIFDFTIDGTMTIDTDLNGKDDIVVSDYTKSGANFIWTDTSAGYSYALSFNPDGSVNEVKVRDIRISIFVGKFTAVNI